MSDCDVVFKIELDGMHTNEEYKTVEEAMEAADIYFAKNHHIKEAKVFKCTKSFLNMTMFNRKFEGIIV